MSANNRSAGDALIESKLDELERLVAANPSSQSGERNHGAESTNLPRFRLGFTLATEREANSNVEIPPGGPGAR